MAHYTFTTWKNKLAEMLTKQLSSEGFTFEFKEVGSPTNTYEGLLVRRKGEKVGLSLRAKNIYRNNPSPKTAFQEVLKIIRTNLQNAPDFSYLSDYQNVKDKLILQLIPLSACEKDDSIPHKVIKNMALVFRIETECNAEGHASALISRPLLERYGLSEDDLFEDALKYAPKNEPAIIKPITAVIKDLIGEEYEDDNDPAQIYVASNIHQFFGASVLAYPGFLSDIATRLGSYYIIPSSIHELLIIPDNGGFEAKDLEALLQNTNSTVVESKDWLSDTVYRYDANTCELDYGVEHPTKEETA